MHYGGIDAFHGGELVRTEQITGHTIDDFWRRDFIAAVLGVKFVCDFTILEAISGWPKLAIVVILSTRTMVGWSMYANMRTALVGNATRLASRHGCFHPVARFITTIECCNTALLSSQAGRG